MSQSATHAFSKHALPVIRLLAGLGVDGDAHAGTTVKHRSRVARDPTQPNLRQVHLIHCELFAELTRHGYAIEPGQLGENVCTRGIDLLSLSVGTRLQLGADAVIEVTGLRNPCMQLDAFAPGLMKALSPRDHAGNIVRKAGVMAVVVTSGDVRTGDGINVLHAPIPHRRLQVV